MKIKAGMWLMTINLLTFILCCLAYQSKSDKLISEKSKIFNKWVGFGKRLNLPSKTNPTTEQKVREFSSKWLDTEEELIKPREEKLRTEQQVQGFCRGKELWVMGVESIPSNNTARIFTQTHYYEVLGHHFERIAEAMPLPYGLKEYTAQTLVLNTGRAVFVCNTTGEVTCKKIVKRGIPQKVMFHNMANSKPIGFVPYTRQELQFKSNSALGAVYDHQQVYGLQLIEDEIYMLPFPESKRKHPKLNLTNLKFIVSLDNHYFAYSSNQYCQLESITNDVCNETNIKPNRALKCPFTPMIDKSASFSTKTNITDTVLKMDNITTTSHTDSSLSTTNSTNYGVSRFSKKTLIIVMAIIIVIIAVLVLTYLCVNCANKSRPSQSHSQHMSFTSKASSRKTKYHTPQEKMSTNSQQSHIPLSQ